MRAEWGPGRWGADAGWRGDLTPEELVFTCPICQKTSANPNDIRNSYCGNCHLFTGELLARHLQVGRAAALREWNRMVALREDYTAEQRSAHIADAVVDALKEANLLR